MGFTSDDSATGANTYAGSICDACAKTIKCIINTRTSNSRGSKPFQRVTKALWLEVIGTLDMPCLVEWNTLRCYVCRRFASRTNVDVHLDELLDPQPRDPLILALRVTKDGTPSELSDNEPNSNVWGAQSELVLGHPFRIIAVLNLRF